MFSHQLHKAPLGTDDLETEIPVNWLQSNFQMGFKGLGLFSAVIPV